MARQVKVELVVDADGAVRGIRTAEGGLVRFKKEAGQVEGQVKRLDRIIDQAFGFTVGQLATQATAALTSALGRLVRQGFEVLSDAVQAAGVQDIAERKLEQALRNTGDASEESAEKLKQVAAEVQNISNFGDESILTAQAMLLSFQEVGGAQGAELLTKRLADTAAGIQRAEGGIVDLNTVAAAFGRALTQGSGALTRFNVSLTDQQQAAFDAAEGMERVQLLAEILDANFEGLAEATADPFFMLRNSVGDLLQELGGPLRAVLTDIAVEIKQAVEDEDVQELARAFGERLADAIREVYEYLKTNGPTLEEVVEQLGDLTDSAVDLAKALSGQADGLVWWLRQTLITLANIADASRGEWEPVLRRLREQYTFTTDAVEENTRALGENATQTEILRQLYGDLYDELFQQPEEAVAGTLDALNKEILKSLQGALEIDTERLAVGLIDPLEQAERRAGALEGAIAKLFEAGKTAESPVVRDLLTQLDAAKARIEDLRFDLESADFTILGDDDVRAFAEHVARIFETEKEFADREFELVEQRRFERQRAADEAAQAEIDAAFRAVDAVVEAEGRKIDARDDAEEARQRAALQAAESSARSILAARDEAEAVRVAALQVIQAELAKLIARVVASLGPAAVIVGPVLALAARALFVRLIPSLQGRARGGPVEKGRPYIVGEEGEELFIPEQSGTIVPGRIERVEASRGAKPEVSLVSLLDASERPPLVPGTAGALQPGDVEHRSLRETSREFLASVETLARFVASAAVAAERSTGPAPRFGPVGISGSPALSPGLFIPPASVNIAPSRPGTIRLEHRTYLDTKVLVEEIQEYEFTHDRLP